MPPSIRTTTVYASCKPSGPPTKRAVYTECVSTRKVTPRPRPGRTSLRWPDFWRYPRTPWHPPSSTHHLQLSRHHHFTTNRDTMLDANKHPTSVLPRQSLSSVQPFNHRRQGPPPRKNNWHLSTTPSPSHLRPQNHHRLQSSAAHSPPFSTMWTPLRHPAPVWPQMNHNHLPPSTGPTPPTGQTHHHTPCLHHHGGDHAPPGGR